MRRGATGRVRLPSSESICPAWRSEWNPTMRLHADSDGARPPPRVAPPTHTHTEIRQTDTVTCVLLLILHSLLKAPRASAPPSAALSLLCGSFLPLHTRASTHSHADLFPFFPFEASREPPTRQAQPSSCATELTSQSNESHSSVNIRRVSVRPEPSGPGAAALRSDGALHRSPHGTTVSAGTSSGEGISAAS